MGNRGILHDECNRIVKPWAHKAWVTCLLSFKEIKRPRPFSQGNYSELFFLDETTAFSAGHRPCAHCQRERHLRFKEAWLRANVAEAARSSTNMPEIDNALHNERAIRGGGKQTFDATLSDLPVGAMLEYEGQAFLVATRGYLPWSFEGYGSPRNIDGGMSIKVLTPESIVRTFAIGFIPNAHSSANG
ncbi:hypothetical protein [Ottowia sp.]|uniref:hypothetical protein n=1 Tax=Ottowia sp. TaxID=1898956 RepID=UPI003A88365F